MKKILWTIIIIIVLLVILSQCNGGSSESGENYLWDLYSYKDEFGSDTGEKYIATDYVKGTFCNYHVVDEVAYLRIYIDEDSVYLNVWEYDTKYKPDFGYEGDGAKITVLDANGEKHVLNAKVNDKNEIHFEDKTLVDLIKNNDVIKIHIEMLGWLSSENTALFTIEKDNFDSVYESFTTPPSE